MNTSTITNTYREPSLLENASYSKTGGPHPIGNQQEVISNSGPRQPAQDIATPTSPNVSFGEANIQNLERRVSRPDPEGQASENINTQRSLDDKHLLRAWLNELQNRINELADNAPKREDTMRELEAGTLKRENLDSTKKRDVIADEEIKKMHKLKDSLQREFDQL